jgi:hypothetical protein
MEILQLLVHDVERLRLELVCIGSSRGFCLGQLCLCRGRAKVGYLGGFDLDRTPYVGKVDCAEEF